MLSLGGSIQNTSAAVYTEVVLVRACASSGEPLVTMASTSATAIRILVRPPVIGSATEIWSRSRESSLSIEHHSSARRSFTSPPLSAAGLVMPFNCAVACGVKSGSRPRLAIARCAISFRTSRLSDAGALLMGMAGN